MNGRHLLAVLRRRGRDRLLRSRYTVEVLLGRGAAAWSARGHGASPAPPAPATTGGALQVVAHPDDDLFFINPDLLTDIRAGVPTTTVYVTSGDAGERNAYHRARERGVAAAYAEMAGTADDWVRTRVAVAGHELTEATLVGGRSVRLYFVRLPDGAMDGSGWPRSARTSLRQLVEGRIPVLWTVDSPAQAYTAVELGDVLGGLVAHVRPTTVRTLDGLRDHADGDHSDHHTVARLAAAAAATASVPVRCYVGYPTAGLPENVSGPALAAKTAAVLAYARHDRLITIEPADAGPGFEAAWLRRRYLVTDPPSARWGSCDPADA